MLYYLMSVPICASCTSCHQLWQFSWDIGTDHGKLIASLVVGRSFFFRLNFPVSWFRRASWVSKPIFIGYSRCTMHSRFRCVWLYVLYELAAKSPPRDTILYFSLFCRFFLFTIFVRFIAICWAFSLHDHIEFHASISLYSSFGQAVILFAARARSQ